MSPPKGSPNNTTSHYQSYDWYHSHRRARTLSGSGGDTEQGSPGQADDERRVEVLSSAGHGLQRVQRRACALMRLRSAGAGAGAGAPAAVGQHQRHPGVEGTTGLSGGQTDQREPPRLGLEPLAQRDPRKHRRDELTGVACHGSGASSRCQGALGLAQQSDLQGGGTQVGDGPDPLRLLGVALYKLGEQE